MELDVADLPYFLSVALAALTEQSSLMHPSLALILVIFPANFTSVLALVHPGVLGPLYYVSLNVLKCA